MKKKTKIKKTRNNDLIKEISMLLYGVDFSYDPQSIKERIEYLIRREKELCELQDTIEVVKSFFNS